MDNEKKQQTIGTRQKKMKEQVLEQLRKYPIVLVACEKAGISRPTYYRWREEDKEFSAAAEKAMSEGEEFFNDLAEHQLVVLVKDKHWGAIHYWLEKRHPKFNKTKLQVDQNIEISFKYDQAQ